MHCLLCGGENPREFEVEGPRTQLWFCPACRFVAKDPRHHLSPSEEKSRYDTHENGTDGHREFLRPVVDAVVAEMPAGSRGLDWGSGPVPALAEVLRSRGFEIRTYDPFYSADFDPTTERGGFDFVTLTEVIEHMWDPARELRLIASQLRAGGKLFVQTELWEPPGELRDPGQVFPRWYYRRDPTHVGFYSARTFDVFAKLFGLRFLRGERRLFIFGK